DPFPNCQTGRPYEQHSLAGPEDRLRYVEAKFIKPLDHPSLPLPTLPWWPDSHPPTDLQTAVHPAFPIQYPGLLGRNTPHRLPSLPSPSSSLPSPPRSRPPCSSSQSLYTCFGAGSRRFSWQAFFRAASWAEGLGFFMAPSRVVKGAHQPKSLPGKGKGRQAGSRVAPPAPG